MISAFGSNFKRRKKLLFMTEFKTPRPVPILYSSNSCSFSTKKERKTPCANKSRSKSVVKTAPVFSRLFKQKWMAQKPRRISFVGPNSTYTDLSSQHYDENAKDSYFEQCFTIEAKIGEGSFGEVFKVRSKEDGRVYAVKKSIESFRSAAHRQKKLSEVQKHEQLPKHPNVVQFVKAWEERGCLYIQTELCKTSLSSYTERTHELPESIIWNYLVDLLLAIKHLHDYDLIHLDVKPENIFISKEGVLKLGDFGLVTQLKTQQEKCDDTVTEGDSKYLAPEVLRGYVGKHVDIFSLGVTILEIACDLDLPSQGETWQLLRSGILPNNLISHLSPDLRSIIYDMMSPDHKQRPSADELLNDGYIKQLTKTRLLYISYVKLLNMLKTVSLFAWIYGVFLLRRHQSRNAALLHNCHYYNSHHHYHHSSLPNHHNDNPSSLLCSRLKRKNVHSVSFSNGIKRKLAAISNESEVSSTSSPLRIARLNFSDDDTLDDEILHELSAIENPDVCDPVEENDYCGGPSKYLLDDGDDEDHPNDSSLPDPINFNNSNRGLKGISENLNRPWNSTPAHSRLRRRIILSDRGMLNCTSSPVTENAAARATEDNVVHFCDKIEYDDCSCTADEDIVDNNNSSARKNLLNIFGGPASTPDDVLHSKRSAALKKNGFSRISLTPKNLMQEFEDDSSSSSEI